MRPGVFYELCGDGDDYDGDGDDDDDDDGGDCGDEDDGDEYDDDGDDDDSDISKSVIHLTIWPSVLPIGHKKDQSFLRISMLKLKLTIIMMMTIIICTLDEK